MVLIYCCLGRDHKPDMASKLQKGKKFLDLKNFVVANLHFP